jgi:hypothetical protein
MEEARGHSERAGISSGKYSWDKKNEYMDNFLTYIKKFSRLYRSVPFIQSIYLCNAITFNALHQDSDIDVFIVTKK